MKATQPKVVISGDDDVGTMAKHGGIIGFSYFHIVWGFGFLPGSENATLYGISTPQKKFVLARFNGEIEDEFVGERDQLPKKFNKVINFRFLLARDFVSDAAKVMDDSD